MSIKQATYKSIRYQIITSNLPAGKKISENELMQEYGIGRTPLREIFLDLQRDGLIEIIPKLGTRVVSMDLKVLRETVQLRRELERFAAELAANNISSEQLAEFRQLLDEAAKINDTDTDALKKMADVDMNIHHLIYKAAANDQLMDIIRMLLDKMSMYWFQVGFSAREFQGQFEELEEVYHAMKNGDAAKAKIIMRKHIDHFANLVKKNMF